MSDKEREPLDSLPEGLPVVAPARVLGRIWGVDPRGGRYIDRGEPDECWLWMRATDRDGYGKLNWKGSQGSETTSAHRVAYQAEYGPIPWTMTVDHTCRVRACCNPAHLQLMTRQEMARQGGLEKARRQRAARRDLHRRHRLGGAGLDRR